MQRISCSSLNVSHSHYHSHCHSHSMLLLLLRRISSVWAARIVFLLPWAHLPSPATLCSYVHCGWPVLISIALHPYPRPARAEPRLFCSDSKLITDKSLKQFMNVGQVWSAADLACLSTGILYDSNMKYSKQWCKINIKCKKRTTQH